MNSCFFFSILLRISKKDIRMLEDELSQIQIASAAIPGANSIEFDNETLAVLRGRCVRYLMRSKEVRDHIDGFIDLLCNCYRSNWEMSTYIYFYR